MIYWGKGRTEQAKRFFQQCGDRPDFPPFYMTRANLFKSEYSEQVLSDYKKAIKLDKNSWRAYHLLTGYYSEIALYDKALDVSQQAYKKFPDNFVLGMDYVKALLHNEKYKDCLLTLAAALLNDRSTAEDVVQDVFVTLVKSPPKLRLAGSTPV